MGREGKSQLVGVGVGDLWGANIKAGWVWGERRDGHVWSGRGKLDG